MEQKPQLDTSFVDQDWSELKDKSTPENILRGLDKFLEPVSSPADLAPLEDIHPALHNVYRRDCTGCRNHDINENFREQVAPGFATIYSYSGLDQGRGLPAYCSEHPFFDPIVLRFEIFVAIVMHALTIIIEKAHKVDGCKTKATERTEYLQRTIGDGSDSILFPILKEGYFDERMFADLASDAQLWLITRVMVEFMRDVKDLVRLLKFSGSDLEVERELEVEQTVARMEGRGPMVEFLVELRAPSAEERIWRYLQES